MKSSSDSAVETKKQIKKARLVLLCSITLTILLLGFAVIAGLTRAPHYFLAALPGLTLAGASWWAYLRWSRLKVLLKLKERWKQRADREHNFNAIASLHQYLHAGESSTAIIDDQTWHDLNLNEICPA